MGTNETFDCIFDVNSGFYILHVVVFFCCAVVIVDSFIVTFVIWRTPALHTNTNILFLSSIFSDILQCVVYVATQALNIFANKLLSNFLICASFGLVLISLVHLGAIAIDRYIHIAHPFFYMKEMTKGRVLKILVSIWTVGLLYTLAPLIAFREDSFQEKCTFLRPPLAYYIAGCTAYMVNIIAVFTCYLMIACLAFQHKKAANARRLHNNDNNGAIMFRHNFRAALRSVKFFAIMFGIYAFCTLPTMLCSGINRFYKIPNSILIPLLYLMVVNSIATVWVYMIINKEFNKALILIFSEIKQRCLHH